MHEQRNHPQAVQFAPSRFAGGRFTASPPPPQFKLRNSNLARRLFLLLPLLALLAGTLMLLDATPSLAQSPTAPGVPRNVKVTPSDGKLTITWQAPSSWGSWDAAGYAIEWRRTPGAGEIYTFASVSQGTEAFDAGSTDTSFVFTARQWDWNNNEWVVTNGVSYDLRIAAFSQQPGSDGTANSHFSVGDYVTVANQVPADPPKPTGLSVTAGNGRLEVSWSAPAGSLTGYDVHYTRAPASGNNSVADDAAEGSNVATAWVDQARSGIITSQVLLPLTNGTAYRVRVRAKHDVGDSGWVVGTGTPSASVPAAPTSLSVENQGGGLKLTWTAPTGSVTAYDVSYTTAPASGTGAVVNDGGGGPGGQRCVYRLGDGHPHRHDGLADDCGPDQRHRLPGAGAGEVLHRRRRLGAQHGHPGHAGAHLRQRFSNQC